MREYPVVIALLALWAAAASAQPSLVPQPPPAANAVIVPLTPAQTTAVRSNRMASVLLSPEQVTAVMRAQSVTGLRYALIVKCNGTCGPTAPAPQFRVGTLWVSSLGEFVGLVRPGTDRVAIGFDGSRTPGAEAVPAADGVFSGALPASLRDGARHTVRAYAVAADGTVAQLDRPRDGNGDTLSFTWRPQ
jgi:hypothetical protein